jgi:DNA-binding MarR family transcriptional regulator
MSSTPEAPARGAPEVSDADAERLGRAFERFLGALRRARGRVPTGSDARLTLAQLHLARALDAQPRRTVRELAEVAGVTQPTVTRALDGLQRQGLVRRVASPDDRRCVLVELTEQGDEVLASERARLDARRRELLAELSDDERRQVERLLLRLADLVERL